MHVVHRLRVCALLGALVVPSTTLAQESKSAAIATPAQPPFAAPAQGTPATQVAPQDGAPLIAPPK